MPSLARPRIPFLNRSQAMLVRTDEEGATHDDVYSRGIYR